MKKNISINISGIIFHIEEDGYETLRHYLDSINKYFGSFEDSSEILADIESRIAEIFLSKLNDGKQVIAAEDVQSLIATMGNVNDFKAAEEQEVAGDPGTSQQRQEQKGSSSSGQSSTGTKKLFRDQKRKILGGVCAGLGHYFNVDPVWPRLLFALLVLASYGSLLLIYIVLWIALPFSHDLEDEPSVKKMYRDTENKVIGGVAGGIAAFFGANVVVIRLLFVAFTIFFGTGLVVYIVLWIALPEARTITDRMQMHGEPVTLSNIESSVKKSLNEKDEPEESLLAKIILFPFRMIAAVLNGIVSVLGPLFKVLVDVLRVAIGLVISLTGFMFIVTFVFIFCVLLGVLSPSAFSMWQMHLSGTQFPLEAIRQAFPTWTLVFAFLTLFIPALTLLLLGNSIIAKRIIFNGLVGWTLFVVFFVGVAFLSFSIPQLVYSFKEEGEVKVEKFFTTQQKIPVLKLRETGMDDYHFTELTVNGHDGTDLKLVERFRAQGASKMKAKENAQQIDYKVEQTDSVITFDSNVEFKKGSKYSFQHLEMDLYVPYDQPFVIDEELWRLIQNHWQYDIYTGKEATQTFKIGKSGKLECVTCPPRPKDLSGLREDDQFGLKDFNEIEMTGALNVVIRQGDEYAIQLEGNDRQKKLYNLNVDGETLEVNYQPYKKDFWKNTFTDDELVELTITMPSLHKLKVTGTGKIKLTGFNEQETKIAMLGAMVVDARISANQLYMDLSGPVVFELDGQGDFMEATISKAAQLKASSYTVDHGIIEAKDLSHARVNVTGTLEIDKDFTSNVRYQGSPQIVNRD